MTVRAVDSIARPDAEPSRMYSDSGVVTRMCGGRRPMLARSPGGRVPGADPGADVAGGRPDATSSSSMPPSGTSRFFCTSFESAFNGET